MVPLETGNRVEFGKFNYTRKWYPQRKEDCLVKDRTSCCIIFH